MRANLAVKLSLLSLALTHICVSAIETPEPSSLLRPRDINPHPYGNAYEGVSIFDKSIITNSEKFMENLLKYEFYLYHRQTDVKYSKSFYFQSSSHPIPPGDKQCSDECITPSV